jgi:uncharacterized protein YbjQ (UPF0145 family)
MRESILFQPLSVSKFLGPLYNPLQVIYATARLIDRSRSDQEYEKLFDMAVGNALGKLQANAMNLGADGVIGVHLSAASGGTSGNLIIAIVMGTAIKFF